MNVLLWVLQILLALHTLMGAMWKFSTGVDAVPSLKALGQPGWLALAIVEILCAVGLVLPALKRSLGKVAAISAAVIAVEMLLFCVLHLASDVTAHGEMVYWLVVAAFAGFIAWGRLVKNPL